MIHESDANLNLFIYYVLCMSFSTDLVIFLSSKQRKLGPKFIHGKVIYSV